MIMAAKEGSFDNFILVDKRLRGCERLSHAFKTNAHGFCWIPTSLLEFHCVNCYHQTPKCHFTEWREWEIVLHNPMKRTNTEEHFLLFSFFSSYSRESNNRMTFTDSFLFFISSHTLIFTISFLLIFWFWPFLCHSFRQMTLRNHKFTQCHSFLFQMRNLWVLIRMVNMTLFFVLNQRRNTEFSFRYCVLVCVC